MKVYLKNMVCNHCIMVVKNKLEKIGFNPLNVSLGELKFEGELSNSEKMAINNHLLTFGFELIDDKKSRIIEKIKHIIIDLVHHQNNEIKTITLIY